MNKLILIIIASFFLSCSSVEKLQGGTIKDTLELAVPKMKLCYENLLNSNVSLKYSFKAQIHVNDLGFVTKVDVDNRKLEKSLLSCIRVSIFELRFPSPKSKKGLIITQPFNLFPKK